MVEHRSASLHDDQVRSADDRGLELSAEDDVGPTIPRPDERSDLIWVTRPVATDHSWLIWVVLVIGAVLTTGLALPVVSDLREVAIDQAYVIQGIKLDPRASPILDRWEVVVREMDAERASREIQTELPRLIVALVVFVAGLSAVVRRHVAGSRPSWRHVKGAASRTSLLGATLSVWELAESIVFSFAHFLLVIVLVLVVRRAVQGEPPTWSLVLGEFSRASDALARLSDLVR
jgi:hypothetical protein